MKIRDLPAHVTAAKADWTTISSWTGFTPNNDTLTARNKCQSTIYKQLNNGYMLEYITEQFGKPNPGFESAPDYVAAHKVHKDFAGRLIAIHKLKTTSRPLQQILGNDEYRHLQDIWAQDDKRYRWTVAFTVVESFDIIGHPKAKDVLGEEEYKNLFQRPSATLRVLNDKQRNLLADLELQSRIVPITGLGIEDALEAADQTEIDSAILENISADLSGALEGVEIVKSIRLKRRVARLAQQFINQRKAENNLICDNCRFDPKKLAEAIGIDERGFFDVHHKNPLEKGERYTSLKDFALLCPTCHRIEHLILRKPS